MLKYKVNEIILSIKKQCFHMSFLIPISLKIWMSGSSWKGAKHDEAGSETQRRDQGLE